MRFEILGPVAVRRGDVEVTPRGPQLRRLLAVLVAAWPEPVAVDVLSEVLWPRGAPSANALQAQVSKLRRVLDPVPIHSTGRGYALDVDGDAVDRAQLEAELARATELLGADPAAASTLLERARGRVHGEPLADLADVEWARAERARLALVLQTLDDRRVDALLGVGAAADACTLLESLLVERPLDEHLWSQLMRAQYRLGRQADALRTFQRARRSLTEELGVEPGPELVATQRQVLDHDPLLLGAAATGARHEVAGVAPRPRRASLPARLSSFVGRGELLAEIDRALGSGRLVTLLGPGGMGKTSTALEALRGRREAVHLVELAPLVADESSEVVNAVLDALGSVEPEPVTGREEVSAFERVADGIGELPVLLLIDNCEHVVAATAEVVHSLLEACAGLRVVATSREALGVPGERVVPVPPLPVPDAVELFLERARSAGVDLSAGDAPAPDELGIVLADVAAVCERLDGLPLAIELAAARTRSLTPRELLHRLDDRFSLLSTGPRTVDPRQKTLRGVVEWSHELLDEREQRVFRRLAAFAGGASIEAVVAVCGGGELGDAEVLAVVERLIDKSLVVVERRVDGVRYRMLETIAAFAHEQLRASGELEHVLDRHAGFFASVLAPAVRGLMSGEQRRWLDVLTAERENVRRALDVALARADAQTALRLVAPIGWWAYMTGQFEWGAAMLDDALGCPGPTVPDDRALVAGMYGWLLSNGPELDTARAAADEALGLLVAVDDPWVGTVVSTTCVMVAYFHGDIDAAHRIFAEAAAAARDADDPSTLALVDLVRGEVLQASGTVTEAAGAFAAAASGFERVGDDFLLSVTLGEAADVHEQLGEYDPAMELLRRAVRVAEQSGFSSHTLALRASMANVEMLHGDLDAAERRHHEVIEALDGKPFQWLRAISWNGLAMIARRRDDPDAADRWLDLAAGLRRTATVPHVRGLVLVARGYTADLRGDARTAYAHQRAGLDIHVELGSPRSIAYSLEGVAGALAAGGDPSGHELAARLLGHADSLRRSVGGPMPAAERFDVDRAERRLRRHLGDDRVGVLLVEGADEDLSSLLAALDRLDGGDLG